MDSLEGKVSSFFGVKSVKAGRQAMLPLAIPFSIQHVCLPFFFHWMNLQCGFVAMDHPYVMSWKPWHGSCVAYWRFLCYITRLRLLGLIQFPYFRRTHRYTELGIICFPLEHFTVELTSLFT
jgi:hypothetical protein